MATPSPITDEWKAANVMQMAQLGVRTRITRKVDVSGFVVSLSVTTGPQPAAYRAAAIPRPNPDDYPQRYFSGYSTRAIIEDLITQLNAQLAVEALEGR